MILVFKNCSSSRGKTHLALKVAVSTLNSNWLLSLPSHLTNYKKKGVFPDLTLFPQNTYKCHPPFKWLPLGSPSETKHSTQLFRLQWEQSMGGPRVGSHTGVLLMCSDWLLYVLIRGILTMINSLFPGICVCPLGPYRNTLCVYPIMTLPEPWTGQSCAGLPWCLSQFLKVNTKT